MAEIYIYQEAWLFRSSPGERGTMVVSGDFSGRKVRTERGVKVKRVLLVFKKSTLQLQAVEHREPRFIKLLEEGNVSVAKVKIAHEEHMHTIEIIESVLKERDIEFTKVVRAELDGSVEHNDLVISVGGDGTFLDSSHSIRTTPILGVNSALSTSFGHFCLASELNFAQIIDDIISDKLAPHKMLRLQLTLGGRPLPELVLNEVLIAHSNPAGTSRYHVEIDGIWEEQRSSGMFVGPPPGSTGSIRSAGGAVLPITEQNYQYIVREPWTKPGQKFAYPKGILPRSKKLTLISHMRTGMIFVDGSHIEYGFPLGEELVIEAAQEDLISFIDPAVNEQFNS